VERLAAGVKIPLVNLKPLLQETEAEWRRRLRDLFARSQFILGPELAGFETELAAEFGARFAVGVGSGTSAIDLCLRAAALPMDRRDVVTTPLTAPFTALAILNAGCRPVFADIDPETLLLGVGKSANRTTKRTGALVPVHLYGQTCDLSAFAALAQTSKTELIQDACQAHGARWKDRPFTAFSNYVAYSFYPTKNLGCLGDGGAVLTNRTTIARRIRLLRDGGRDARHVSSIAGVNSRLAEIQACFLRCFLKKLPAWNAQRRRLASLYEQALEGCRGLRIVRQQPGSVYHLFVIRVLRRRQLRDYLAQYGIGTGVHYPVPLHLHPAFRDCGSRRGDLPEAEKACREILSLPLWPGMPETAALEVADRIRAFSLRL
jgi:dTDP-3-amino-3,4,6-trideoxy-alpha-D-glucose transaminase